MAILVTFCWSYPPLSAVPNGADGEDPHFAIRYTYGDKTLIYVALSSADGAVPFFEKTIKTIPIDDQRLVMVPDSAEMDHFFPALREKGYSAHDLFYFTALLCLNQHQAIRIDAQNPMAALSEVLSNLSQTQRCFESVAWNQNDFER